MPRKAIWVVILAAAAFGCGGGGGGGSPAPQPGVQPPPPAAQPQRPPAPTFNYTGRPGPALIDDANAYLLTKGPVLIPVTASNLVALFRVNVYPDTFDGVLQSTVSGPGGGQVTLRGVLERGSGPTSTGWLSLEFEDFASGDYFLDGRIVQDVRAPFTGVSHSVRLEFTDLRLKEPHADHVLNGVVEDVRASVTGGNRRTVSANLLQRNVATGEEIWAENFVAFADRIFLFAAAHTYTGRVHHSAHGYVDVSSDRPLVFLNSEPRPDRGGPLRFRGASSSAGLVALNTEYAAVVLDDDGDGVDERFSRLTWPALLSALPPNDTSSPAVANAGAKRAAVVGEPFELDGLLSHDRDASFLTVDWTLAVKPAGSTAALDLTEPLTPSFTPDVAGYYMFTLEVKDPDGDAHDSVVVQALPPHPNTGLRGVQIRMDRPNVVPLATTVSLDASTSRREDLTDSSALDVRHSWTLGVPPGSSAALTAVTSPKSSFMPDVPGFYRMRVENTVSVELRGEMAKIVGFGTGFQYFESAHLAVDAGLHGDPVFADFDGDGSMDVAALGASPSGTGWVIRVWPGDGNGSARAAAEFRVDNSADQLLHGDIDGDGLHDLVTLGSETLYVVYTRNPIASSTLRAIPLNRGALCGYGYSQWAALTDGDNDGRAELLVADTCQLAMLTWRHRAGGALALDRQQAIPELRGRPVVFGDLTDDGRVDFVVPRDPPSPQDALLLFAQSSSGDFSLRQILEGAVPGAIGIGDVTGDGRDDLVRAREPVLSVFPQLPNFMLASAMDYAVGRLAAIPPRFADLDGDGRTDLVAVGERGDLVLALQQPQGSLALVTLPDDLEQNSDSAAIPVDWNGDGRVDLLRRRHVMSDVGFNVRLRMP
jgi:hypothetical protein